MADPWSIPDLATLALYRVDTPYLELGHGTFGQTVLPNPKTGVDPCEVWCNQPVERLREYCNVIKIQMLWPLLFTQQSTSFQGQFGLMFQEWHLWKTICECNFLEDLADLIKKVVNIPHFISGILKIGNGIENGFFQLEEALDWIRCVGDANIMKGLEELGDFGRLKLVALFTQWERSITKVALEGCDLVEELKALTCESSRKDSELMKQKGNDEFSRRAFVSAIISYTRAIELCRTNHLLYGNRALCFILTGDYGRAVADGKRAIILKPDWPKGHHHFCKALSLLGRHQQALEANERAQELCRNGPEGLKELVQQHQQLKKEWEEMNGPKQRKQKAKRSLLEKKDCSSSKSHGMTSQGQKEIEKNRKRAQADAKGPQKQDAKVTDTQRPESKVSTLELPQNQSHQNKRRQKPKPGDSEKMRDHLDLKRESKAVEDKNLCPVPQMDFSAEDVKTPRNKGFTASRDECAGDKPTPLPLLRAVDAAERQVSQVDFNALPEGVTSLARDGCAALMEQQCHSAEQAFSQLLSILYTSEFRYMNIHNINYVIIIYGHATALLGIGQPEALAKAEEQFKRIIEENLDERCFCLAHYGIGRVYLRQNRFAHALDQFLRSKLMIDFKMVPGVLTWPATTQVIEETRTESLQMALRSCIEECKFPPEPDAVCRYQQCHGHSKIQIFFTDPDFKGFIRVICCQQCRVEFHISCWKKLKTTSYSDKNDKDFLKELCFTPDCKGLISKILIFSSSGLLKCEFEQKITKPRGPPRACIKQKCSSIRKLKAKQEKKLRRKRAREEARNSARRKAEEKQEGKERSERGPSRGYGPDFSAGDRVLQHLSRNSEQIQTAVADAAKLLKELLSWFVISEEDYTSYSQISSKPREVMEQLLSHLIQEKNRVKTRGFIHVLSQLEGVDPKLLKWLKHLNNLGLTATKNFLHQYEQSLQELDFAVLATLWNQKYGRRFDYVPAPWEKQEIWEYFLKPPLEKSRCFIWLLEDNRERFPSLHPALDEFFDKMDDPTIILKKQGNENISNNDIKVKNKNRKKNLKDSRSILVLSSGVSTAPREEEKIFIEGNTLYTDFTNEPFVIPEYLQEQLEEFEALYEVSNSNSYNNNNNNPDAICEYLYGYFSQILEEHGPLEINNKLLIGEYENFPEGTRRVVEDQGGLESFLLKSLRFIMVDNLIGLRKHSVLFEGNTNGSESSTDGDVPGNHSQKNLRLNPDAEEFKPQSYPVQPHIPPPPDLNYETLQYLPCSFPASWRSRNSLQSQSIESTENQSLIADILLKESSVFVPQTSWGYQYRRILPVPFPVPVLPRVARQPGYIYADPAAPRDNRESAISVGKHIPAETQTCENPGAHSENSADTVHKESLAAPGSSDEAENGKQGIKVEKGSKSKSGMKSNPHVRMVAVQVNQEVADRETNTLPFHPFENQPGDILRVEKEHHVLQEQLKEAEEKFEQLQSRSSEEVRALEELLRKSVEETEVSQNELDWFHQDSEAQGKKWQQEKKENRDSLKALRSTAKKHTDTNERYLKTINDKEKQYNTYLNTFLDTSNKFANEKVKLEELIKKSQDDCQECVKRAVKAEISVFQNWKEAEVWKLSGTVAKAEANLKMLKALGSSSASAAPLLKSQIDSWETFISNVKKQLEKVEAEYEEKMELVRSGAQISLTKVEIMDIPSPPTVPIMPASPSVSDPAILTYSLASAHPAPLPAFSSPEAQGASFGSQPGAKAAPATAEAPSASAASVKTHPQPPEGSHSNKLPSSHPAGISGGDAGPAQNPQDASALQPRPPALPNNKKLPKALENIIAQLQSIFPNYSSSDFTPFIREVQRRNGNTLSGLSRDEVLNRVTELILDQQSQAPTAAGRASAPPAPTGARSREVAAERNAPSPSRAAPAPKNTSNKNPSQPNLQAWGNVGATPKAKWKKQDDTASSEDPCTICHDELSRDSCELECGHHFHRECIRTWLKEHSSTCPICRVHALLPEDFPELPAWNKFT
ncbi:E3 ubiquitin-protein ligase TTC3 [Empidonax traillii]|uniref:E3 ubiquitin-protein ligase TTC3 n=1 Tax=Empidonax traillii TaxID=164674 RepID=UPI000FFDB007|nr:E3 ubiquitin-protein ligase TTC3 [Empidonax traillii]